jgi:parvulin-like peptidyl-prolyl isomerase
MWPRLYQDDKSRARSGWGLLACLGLALALAGARVQPPAEPTDDVLLWVNERPITRAQLSYAQRRLTDGRDRDLSDAERSAVIDLLIDEELLLQRAQSLGVLEADPGVRKAIVQAAISEIVEEFLSRPFDRQQLQHFFQQHSAVFEHPPRVAVAALRFNSMAAAQRAAAAIAQGSAWADVAAMPQAQSVSHLPGSPLPAHVLRRYLGPGLASVALTMKSGEISQPVESAGSVYLLQVNSVVASSVPGFDEIVPDVRAEYLSRGREDALASKLAQLWLAADIRFNPGVAAELVVSGKDHFEQIRIAGAGDRAAAYIGKVE